MRKEEIKKAALKIFAHKGYAECAMQDIAHAMALNKASLYFYFKSKNEMYTDILKEIVDSYFTAVQKTVEEYKDSPVETLLFEVFKTFVHHSTLDELLLWKKSLLMGLSDVDDEVREVTRAINYKFDMDMQGIIYELLSAKTRQPEQKLRQTIDSFHLFIFSLLDWVIINANESRFDVNEVIKSAWNTYWNGARIE